MTCAQVFQEDRNYMLQIWLNCFFLMNCTNFDTLRYDFVKKKIIVIILKGEIAKHTKVYNASVFRLYLATYIFINNYLVLKS